MGCLDDRVMLFNLKLAACCLGLAVVNIYEGGQLHRCPLEACVCMAVHGPIPVTPLNSSVCTLWTPCSHLSSGPAVWMDTTPPSAGRRSLMKTASPGSITVGRSFMKMTACCQGTGRMLSDYLLSTFREGLYHYGLFRLWNTDKDFLCVIDRYQNSDTEYETPKGYHHPDSYYDDDEQPLYRDSRRSPKRRLLPATPQGT